jgi:RHS repeat-associated protein
MININVPIYPIQAVVVLMIGYLSCVSGLALNVASNIGFTGQNTDANTGLVALRARYYDPETGAFISKDPLGLSGSINGYSYCDNNPINCVDLTGLLDGWLAARSGVGIVGNGLLALAGAGASEVGIGVPFLIYGSVGVGANFANLVLAFQTHEGQKADPFQTGAITIAAQGVMGGIQLGGGSISQNTYNDVTFGANALDLGASLTSGKAIGDSAPWVAAYGITQSKTVISLLSSVDNADSLISSGEALSDSGQALGLFSPPPSPIDNLSPTATYDSGGNNPPSSVSMPTLGPTPDQNWLQIDPDDESFNFNGTMNSPPVGGVLLNTAATLVGQNLSDITGAMYDPVSGQFVFLGTNSPTPVKNINLDYLYTALQAVYGSAQPPFVTLNPPAAAYNQWSGSLAPGGQAGFTVLYDPIWPNVDTTVDVVLSVTQNGSPLQWRARFNCVPESIFTGYDEDGPVYGTCMLMAFNNWVADAYATLPPAGILLNTNAWQTNSTSTLRTLYQNGNGFATYTPFTLHNGTANNYAVNSALVVPARQHREFGGRVENTQVGWVMEEADRVMKCLSVGVDNLTGATYNSGTASPALNTIPGYQNMQQRLAGSSQLVSVRFWFTPDQMTLQQYVDPNTGLASIVFTNSTVSLNTESYMEGLPQAPQSAAFAANFTTNYDQFAALKFPCYNPNDPTGKSIIYTNIFGMLRDVMKAVSLARFFRDNDVKMESSQRTVHSWPDLWYKYTMLRADPSAVTIMTHACGGDETRDLA